MVGTAPILKRAKGLVAVSVTLMILLKIVKTLPALSEVGKIGKVFKTFPFPIDSKKYIILLERGIYV